MSSTPPKSIVINQEQKSLSGIESPLFWTGSLFLFLILSYYAWRLCSTLELNYDVGLIAIGADLICQGDHLYSDIHTVMPPGAYLVLAALFKLFGSSFFVCQVATTTIILLAGGLTLTLSRKFICGWLALLPVTIVVVTGALLNPYFSHHWCSVCFFLVFANCLVLLCTKNKPPKKFELFVSGLAGGLSIICYQPQVVPIVTCSIFGSFLLEKKHRLNGKKKRFTR